jgi:hypothetical protein
MAVERTYTIVSVAWNGTTYDANSGGPLGLSFGHPGRTVLDRTADDVYPAAVIIPEKDVQASFRLRQMTVLPDPGANKSDLVFILKHANRPTANTYTLTIKDMVFTGEEASLQRSVPGESTLNFVYEHDVGDTGAPIVKT